MIGSKTLVALGMVAMLAACGGGGGGAGPDPAPAPGPTDEPIVVVTTQTNQVLTAADCPRLTNNAASLAAVDLSNSSVKAVHDLLLKIDEDHAYNVFIRLPNNFINWVMLASGNTGKLDITSLGVAVHETMHEVDAALAACAPAGHKLQFFGNLIPTGLVAGDTSSYGIVAETIAPALQTAARYEQYITGLGANPANQFPQLLDELAAYTGAAHTEFQMLSKAKTDNSMSTLDVNLGGAVNFMVYLENYLKAARLNHPATYDAIRNNAQTVAVIQAVWNAAEQALKDSYPYTKADSVPQLVVSGAYFNAAYSADLLSELDAIGVTHAAAASWSGTYLP